MSQPIHSIMKLHPVSTPVSTCDVAIAGGGPAGAAVATFLARRGYRCTIFQPGAFPRYHIGESLIPQTYGILDRLGVLPQLKSSLFPRKHSVRFVAQDGRESAPFYFSETIPGEGAVTWQVERGEFDRILLEHAKANGVEVCAGQHVRSVVFEDDRAVGVDVANQQGRTHRVGAKVVVDASGRSCLIGNQLGLKTIVPELNKASIWGYFKGGARLPGIDAGETTIFQTRENGWFWYIPLPNDIVSVGIVGTPNFILRRPGTFAELLRDEIAACTPLAARLAKAEQHGPVRGLPRLAYANRKTCGDGWLMIGDARAFLDPIYSSGLFLALGSAELAAECIHEALAEGDVSAARLGAFEPKLWSGVEVIRRLIHAFYDPAFSFAKFVERFPQHRPALIDCLVGDVLKDMGAFTRALSEMTPPPGPLIAAA